MKKANPGGDFEAAFAASVPRGVYLHKLRTPAGAAFLIPKLIALVEHLCKQLRAPVPEWVTKARRIRFVPPAAYDFILVAPAPFDVGTLEVGGFHVLGGAPTPLVLPVQPSAFFALELKSVDGVSLPFGNVDADQEKALRSVAACGHLAGLVVEFRKAAECWFVPIQAWAEYRLIADRQSLPLEIARRIGLEIKADPLRSGKSPRWLVGDWLRRCGCSLGNSP